MNKREIVFNKFGGRCAYCGCVINIHKFQIDHIVPKCEKYFVGQEELSNLNPACQSCNNYKRHSSLENFRKGIEMQIERLRRDKPTFRLAERYRLITCNSNRVLFYFETVLKQNEI